MIDIPNFPNKEELQKAFRKLAKEEHEKRKRREERKKKFINSLKIVGGHMLASIIAVSLGGVFYHYPVVGFALLSYVVVVTLIFKK